MATRRRIVGGRGLRKKNSLQKWLCASSSSGLQSSRRKPCRRRGKVVRRPCQISLRSVGRAPVLFCQLLKGADPCSYTLVRRSCLNASVITGRLTVIEQLQSTSPAGMSTVAALVSSSPRCVSAKYKLLFSIASANIRRNNGRLLLGILEYAYVKALSLLSDERRWQRTVYILLSPAMPKSVSCH